MRVLLVVYDNDSYIHWFPQGLASVAAVLRDSGHEVTKLVIYETRKPTHQIQLDLDSLDAITFTSPSTAKNFIYRPIKETAIACIGTTTYKAVQDLGFKNSICAREHSSDGLIQALEEHFIGIKHCIEWFYLL